MSIRNNRTHGAATALAIAAAAVALPAVADETPPPDPDHYKQTNLGAATGLAIGALAGGPVGAVVGAGVGVVVGEGWHRQAQSKAALQAQLQKSEVQRTQLDANVAQLQGTLAQSHARNVQLGQTLQQTDELGVDVSFRTDDDSVTTQDMSPLLKFGALVASIPDARVCVDGYADPRGSQSWNDALSLRRAESVAAVLMAAGVARESISIEGHGKSAADGETADADTYALERRATVRLQLPQAAEVARND
jgi:outer membrane protein OmpA-like peptidoglycan-associated protein